MTVIPIYSKAVNLFCAAKPEMERGADTGKPDLLLAGEWMPIKLLRNTNGKLIESKQPTGLEQLSGWWTSIAGGDFDNDGDIDYICANLGENSFYRADSAHPAKAYAADFGKNKNYMVVPSMFLSDRSGSKKEFPTHSRNDVTSQLPAVKKKYLSYKSFAEADMDNIFGEDLKKSYQLSANYFASVYLENRAGKFIVHRLPDQAQFAPINGMVVDDLNKDGFLDLLYVGNDFGTEVSTGRYDAMNGGLLLGDGKGNFRNASLAETGYYVPGNAKALVKLRGPGKQLLYIASQNRDSLRTFNSAGSTTIAMEPGDLLVEHFLRNGIKRREELYYGTSFLSQSARIVSMHSNTAKMVITNNKGEKRVIENNAGSLIVGR